MRFPYRNGTYEEFDRYFYTAQHFGEKVYYGYHEGVDVNLRTGTDTDLGEPIYAIHDGVVTSVHNHTNIPSFGKHIHYSIKGSWGTYYVHHAHCNDIFVKTGQSIKEGQRIASIGKTGAISAHDHWCIKQKPVGTDNVANTFSELVDGWVGPILFVRQNINEGSDDMDWTNFDPNKDIPTEVEKKFNPVLTSYPWYDKHKSWEWVIDFADDRWQDVESLSKETEELRQEIEDIREKSKLALEQANNEITKLKAKNLELEEQLERCKEQSLEHLTLGDFLTWVGLKLGVKK